MRERKREVEERGASHKETLGETPVYPSTRLPDLPTKRGADVAARLGGDQPRQACCERDDLPLERHPDLALIPARSADIRRQQVAEVRAAIAVMFGEHAPKRGGHA